MADIQLKLDVQGRGAFYILEQGAECGKMEVAVANKILTVYHTEVAPKAEGRGFAKKLLQAMVDYARENNFKVVPLCSFVQAQFKRSAEVYADIIERQ